ncbi:cold-shock protein [Lentzea sp. HUAS12]|uniref:cold-shock protein n=1 Tax=Lentzea sp. HUAS12 TaxID=2951806 RepID=UPI00209D22AA|nr:tetratricopeptide repeat protein [Lentzea sp. HUAS12]USX48474.1 tetratricopeptide repeat protein [Lentzea sp. HUAS12]
MQAGSIGSLHVGQAGDPAAALADPIIATVEVEPSLTSVYVDDDPPAEVAHSGAVHVITVEARTTRAVVLLGLRPVVVSRRPPRRACVEVRMGGIITPRPFTADFDDDRPRLTALQQDFPFSVSATDVEQFHFVPHVSATEVGWRLELDWLVAGRRGTTVIDDGGEPFRMYPTEVLAWESDLSWGCGMSHLPGCPSERLAALSRHGVVAVFNDHTGRGLVQPSNGGQLLSLPRSALPAGGPPVPGQPVTYEVRQLPTGPRVHDVRFVGEEAAGLPDAAPSRPSPPHAEAWVQEIIDHAEDHAPESFRAQVLDVLDRLNATGESGLGATVARSVQRAWGTALGGNHRDTLAVANRLAGYLFKLGEHQQAYDLFHSTYERRLRKLGADDPDTLTSASNLALALSRHGITDQVRELREDTLRRRRRVLGEDHRDTLWAAVDLGTLHLLAEEFAAARAVFAEAEQRAAAAFGPDDATTTSAARGLAAALRGPAYDS